jgi:hypothetical protein
VVGAIPKPITRSTIAKIVEPITFKQRKSIELNVISRRGRTSPTRQKANLYRPSNSNVKGAPNARPDTWHQRRAG